MGDSGNKILAGTLVLIFIAGFSSLAFAVPETGDLVVVDPLSERIIIINPDTGDQTLFTQFDGNHNFDSPAGIAQFKEPYTPNIKEGSFVVSNKDGSGFSFFDGITGDSIGGSSGTAYNDIRDVIADGQNIILANSGRNNILLVSSIEDSRIISSDGLFSYPSGIALDSNGDIIVADSGANAIFRVDFISGSQSLISSGGLFVDPISVAFDSSGDIIVADSGANAIFSVDPITGSQSLISSGGFLMHPNGISIDSDDNIYVADDIANSIIKISITSGIQTIISTGDLLSGPTDVIIYEFVEIPVDSFAVHDIFTNPLNISQSHPGEGHNSPSIAANGENIFVIGSDVGSEFVVNPEIWITRSTDGGETFSATQNVSNTEGSSDEPAIATDGTNVYVVWRDETEGQSIYLSKSNDVGVTFSTPIIVGNIVDNAEHPSVATDGTNVFVVWNDDSSGSAQIFFSKSSDGVSFSVPINISDTIGGSSPSITINGEIIFVVWSQQNEIFFSKSTDDGLTFSFPQNISNTQGSSGGPSIAADGTSVFVTWTNEGPDIFGLDDVFFTKSIDGGATFSVSQNISNTFERSFNPSIVANGNNISIVWEYSWVFNERLVLSKSTDGGDTFGVPQIIDNDHTNLGASGPIATDGTSILLVWPDPGPTTSNIFFSKSLTPGSPTILSPGDIIIAETSGFILKVDPITGDETIIFGSTEFHPSDVAIDKNGDIVMTDPQSTGLGTESGVVFKLNPQTGFLSIISEGGLLKHANNLDMDLDGNIIVSTSNSIVKVDPVTGAQSIVSSGDLLNSPRSLSIDQDNNIFVASFGNWRVLEIDPMTGDQTLIANFDDPEMDFESLTLFPNGDVLVGFAQDQPNLLRINPDTGIQTVIPHEDFQSGPLAIDLNGDILVSNGGSSIYKVNPDTGATSLVSEVAFFNSLWGLVVVPDNAVLIIDTIRDYGLSNGIENSLIGPLNDFDSSYNSACNKLDTFLDNVDIKETQGKITVVQADELRDLANNILVSLDC